MRTTNCGQLAKTLEELRRLGRVEKIDAAAVQALKSQAQALDADPSQAALWRVYSQGLRELTSVDDAGGSFEAAVGELFAEVGDATSS